MIACIVVAKIKDGWLIQPQGLAGLSFQDCVFIKDMENYQCATDIGNGIIEMFRPYDRLTSKEKGN